MQSAHTNGTTHCIDNPNTLEHQQHQRRRFLRSLCDELAYIQVFTTSDNYSFVFYMTNKSKSETFFNYKPAV